MSKHAAQINTIINALAIIVLILALIAGFWTYTNKDAVEYLHQKIKQKIQTDNQFKLILSGFSRYIRVVTTLLVL